jgi:hypothetical protein
MAQVPIFHARVTDEGKLELVEAERDRRRVWLQSLAGKAVEVIVRKERLQRTLDQNAYLHAVPFPMLASHIGDSVEGVKFDLMGECWGWTTTKGGHYIPIKPHTSDMSVEECSQFIDWLIPWAMTTHGVDIPLPNEVAA